MDIELTFINQSDDVNNSSILIFQKNMAGANEQPIAWTVIENCGKGWKHPFKYPLSSYISVKDSWGNVSDLQPAENGQTWQVVKSPSGNVLSLDTQSSAGADKIEVKNGLSMGSIDAQIYKDGRLLATRTGLDPQQSALFGFNVTLWIGVVSQIEEGDVINSAILSQINTEISLLGIAKANIIMTGGGPGPDAKPFKFTLQPTA